MNDFSKWAPLNSTKVKPLGNRVFTTYEVGRETVSDGGIIIPATPNDKKRMCEGVIIAVGQGKLLKDGSYSAPMLAAGMRVLYDKMGATGLHIDGVPYAFVDVEAIDGIID